MEFDELVSKLRSGDTQAVQEFVRTYDSFIRRSIRPRIRRANLGAIADSVDICQSVLGSFLIRLAAGEYELQSEQQMHNLLFAIAKKKFAFLVRREYSDRRDRNRNADLASGHFRLIPSHDDDPQATAQHRDLMHQVRTRLNQADREILGMRQEGLSWDDIATRQGATAVLLRKRFSRAINRVAVELGFEEPDD